MKSIDQPECEDLIVPEEDFESDVEGTKLIFYDVGNDERKMEEALEHCHIELGDNATILYFINGETIKKWMKATGANCWDKSTATMQRTSRAGRQRWL